MQSDVKRFFLEHPRNKTGYDLPKTKKFHKFAH